MVCRFLNESVIKSLTVTVYMSPPLPVTVSNCLRGERKRKRKVKERKEREEGEKRHNTV